MLRRWPSTISGADKAMIAHLKSLGCFTEIIAFELRVFVPHGDGIDAEAIVARITGRDKEVAAA